MRGSNCKFLLKSKNGWTLIYLMYKAVKSLGAIHPCKGTKPLCWMKQSASSDSWKIQSGCVDHGHLLSDEKLQSQMTPSGGIFWKECSHDLDLIFRAQQPWSGVLLIHMEKRRVFTLGLSDPHFLSYSPQYFVIPWWYSAPFFKAAEVLVFLLGKEEIQDNVEGKEIPVI